ncbi:MAG TPA: CDP-alcohol phosphatidyltransferase family protein [Kofleriaceae bacterium]|nr:CDP-alcohol phosphatidyltransferase family protein [Kofleriaceae bacterium]
MESATPRPPTYIEVGEANGHRAVLGGLTTLERVIRQLGKQGVTRVVVPAEPFDVEREGVPRVPHGVAVDWIAPGTPPAADQPVVRGDEIAGVRITDEPSRKRAEWAVFKSLPKSHQGPTDAAINQHFSLRITRPLCRTRIHPNHITIASLFWGLAACAIVLQATPLAFAVAGLMMQFHNILDSCDGEMARLRFQFTKSGAWLDNIFDEIVDDTFIACCGIAAGGVWTWIGIAGGAARFLAVALQWEEMLRKGKGGSAYAFRFWFESDESTPDDVYGKRSPLYYVRALGRRDSFVFGFMLLLLLRLPQGVAVWGAATGAVNITLMLLHVLLRRR